MVLEDTTREVFEQWLSPDAHAHCRAHGAVRSIDWRGVTDIVEKEMYSFEDSMNGDKLTLRPEATAGLVRAAIEHNLLYDGPKRVWTWGRCSATSARAEGRYRQFHQFDVEAMGFAGPDVDAEQIIMLRALWRRLRFRRRGIAGQFHRRRGGTQVASCRPGGVLRSASGSARRRRQTALAHQSAAHWIPRTRHAGLRWKAHRSLRSIWATREDPLCRRHRVAWMLRAGLYREPALVRGFDYYNRTVFEFIGKGAVGKLTIAGGGRYEADLSRRTGWQKCACLRVRFWRGARDDVARRKLGANSSRWMPT